MSAGLVAFLSARLAEDEAAAKAAGPDGGEWFARDSDGNLSYGEFGWWVSGPAVETEDSEWGQAVADHIARHDPARVLRQVEAHRAIVELSWHHLGDDDYAWGMEEAKRQVLCHLAAIYSDHADYREEWAL